MRRAQSALAIMKAYIIATGILFACICVAHVVFTWLIWRGARAFTTEAATEAVVAVVAAALTLWAWRVRPRKKPVA